MRLKARKHQTMILHTKVADILDGANLTSVLRHPHSWSFQFSSCSLGVECSWRLIADGRIALTDGDDGHQFGMPAPVDVEIETARRLVGQRVTHAVVASQTADLTISFGDDLRLEVVSNSSGYESWQLNIPGCVIVANGGLLSEAREVKAGLFVGGPWE